MTEVSFNQFDIVSMVLDYIREYYFNVSLNEDYFVDVSDFENYYAITVSDDSVSFRSVVTKSGNLLYCYLTTEKLIDFVDDNNFYVISYCGEMIDKVLHYQCHNQVWYLLSNKDTEKNYKESYGNRKIKQLDK